MIAIKTSEEIAIMSEAGQKLAEVLHELEEAAAVGVRTLDLDKLALKLIRECGAEPAFLNYRPAGAREAYPFTLCASLNDCVVHGRPSNYALKDGDLLKLDLGLKYRGFYVDSAITVGVGDISKEARKLSDVTREALKRGVKACKPGKTLGDIGAAIEKYVVSHKFSVVKSLVGHGIGRELHEYPNVPNFGRPRTGEKLEPGMVLAIEPMVAAGSGETKTLSDDSFVTKDGSLVAHWEHTVAITTSGPRILTR